MLPQMLCIFHGYFDPLSLKVRFRERFPLSFLNLRFWTRQNVPQHKSVSTHISWTRSVAWTGVYRSKLFWSPERRNESPPVNSWHSMHASKENKKAHNKDLNDTYLCNQHVCNPKLTVWPTRCVVFLTAFLLSCKGLLLNLKHTGFAKREVLNSSLSDGAFFDFIETNLSPKGTCL